MVMVPGGAFLREGVDITLGSFWIGNVEVTQGEIVRMYNKGLESREIKGEAGRGIEAYITLKKGGEELVRKRSEVSPYWGGVFYSSRDEEMRTAGNHDYFLVCRTTWYGAVYYCNARSREEGLPPCYEKDGKKWICNFSADGYRLPTEAE